MVVFMELGSLPLFEQIGKCGGLYTGMGYAILRDVAFQERYGEKARMCDR